MQLHADDGRARDPGGSPFACESGCARPRERRAVGARPFHKPGAGCTACSRCWRSRRTAISSSYPIEQTPTSGCMCRSTPTTDAHAIPAALPSPARAVVVARANAALSELVHCDSAASRRQVARYVRTSGSLTVLPLPAPTSPFLKRSTLTAKARPLSAWVEETLPLQRDRGLSPLLSKKRTASRAGAMTRWAPREAVVRGRRVRSETAMVVTCSSL